MSALDRRLKVLEALNVPTDGQLSRTKSARLSASIQALLVAVRPDRMAELLVRLESDSTTETDRAMLDSLPPCDSTPHELVRMVDNLQHEV